MDSIDEAFKEEMFVGAEEAVVGEVSKAVLELVEDLADGTYYATFVLSTEWGREASKAGAAGVLYYFANKDMIPIDVAVSEEKLAAVLRVVMRNSSRNLIRPHLETIRSHLEDMAGKVKELPDKDGE